MLEDNNFLVWWALSCVVFRHQRRKGSWGRWSLPLSPQVNLPIPQTAEAAVQAKRNLPSLNSARRSTENTTRPSCTAGLSVTLSQFTHFKDKNKNSALISFFFLSVALRLFSRVDCSGRRVASLDVDGVIKVNLHFIVFKLRYSNGIYWPENSWKTSSSAPPTPSGVVIQPHHADQSHHHVQISSNVSGVGHQTRPTGSSVYFQIHWFYKYSDKVTFYHALGHQWST